MRDTCMVCATTVLLGALSLGAQEPPPPPAPAPNRSDRPAAVPARREHPEEPQFDQDAVQRGKELLVARCGFCHGSNARGGSSGPDLTRSAMVQEDENGKQLGEFLRVGRPDRGMPKFDLPDARVADVAAFLHAEIYLASNRRLYKILDVLVGDPKAGQAFFNGAGRCSACHSATGDLKG